MTKSFIQECIEFIAAIRRERARRNLLSNGINLELLVSPGRGRSGIFRVRDIPHRERIFV